jgi:hypothetical protein
MRVSKDSYKLFIMHHTNTDLGLDNGHICRVYASTLLTNTNRVRICTSPAGGDLYQHGLHNGLRNGFYSSV